MSTSGQRRRGERISNGSRFNANGAYGAVKFWNQWLSFGRYRSGGGRAMKAA